jgi:flagellar assembly protein FliH
MSLNVRITPARDIDATRIESYPYVFASAVPDIDEILPGGETEEPIGEAYRETLEEKQFRIDSVEQIISEKFERNEKAIEKRLLEVEQAVSEKVAEAEQKEAAAAEKVAQAEESVIQAEQQVAEINRKAYEAGFLLGENEGRETGESQFKVHLARLEDNLAAISDAVSLHRNASGEEVLALITVMAEYLAGQCLGETADAAGPLLRAILDAHPFPLPDSAAPGEPTVVIFMHPKDLDQAKASITNDYPGTRLLPDAALSRGSLRLETADTVIDSTFERRRERLLNLIGRLKEEGQI